MELFNIISGVCSIIGLLLSIFAVTRVVKISNKIKMNNKSNETKKQSATGKNINLAGRDNNEYR